MANTTFSGPVRSLNGFQVVSGDARAVVATIGTDAPPSNLTAGTGITTGVGTVYAASVTRNGSLIETRIFVDLTGLNCGGTAGDIIGKDATANSHLGQITAAVNGTIVGGMIRCLEAPTGGNADIDLFSAVESTGAEDAAISGLTSTQLCNSGALSIGTTVVLTAFPAANEYLYLACGTATDATYTAGKIEIVLYGTA